jgi:hypothetical protein
VGPIEVVMVTVTVLVILVGLTTAVWSISFVGRYRGGWCSSGWRPRGLQVFFGAGDPNAPRVGLTEQLVRRLPAAAETPAGDFRDWPTIDAWSAEIARELLAQDVGAAFTGG